MTSCEITSNQADDYGRGCGSNDRISSGETKVTTERGMAIFSSLSVICILSGHMTMILSGELSGSTVSTSLDVSFEASYHHVWEEKWQEIDHVWQVMKDHYVQCGAEGHYFQSVDNTCQICPESRLNVFSVVLILVLGVMIIFPLIFYLGHQLNLLDLISQWFHLLHICGIIVKEAMWRKITKNFNHFFIECLARRRFMLLSSKLSHLYHLFCISHFLNHSPSWYWDYMEVIWKYFLFVLSGFTRHFNLHL